jgi:hypothetical protein
MSTTVTQNAAPHKTSSTPNPAAYFTEAVALSVLDRLDSAAFGRSDAAIGGPIPTGEPVTRFHSVVLVDVTLVAMARALVNARIHVDWTTVAIATALFARYDAAAPVTPHMTHRLFATCVLIAGKAHQDKRPSNETLARAVAMSARELTLLEFVLGEALDWSFLVSSTDPAWRALVEEPVPVSSPDAAARDKSPGTYGWLDVSNQESFAGASNPLHEDTVQDDGPLAA